jgi:hypothetical protein
MPAWSGKLSDAQIDSLSAYIRSFSNPDGPAGASSSSGQAQETPAANGNIYEPGDDLLFSLPTGRASTSMASTSTSRIASLTMRRSRGRAAAGNCSGWITSRSLLSGSDTA